MGKRNLPEMCRSQDATAATGQKLGGDMDKRLGVMVWRQYVKDIQAWREEYVRLAARRRVALATKYASNKLPGGELTANDWN